MPTPVSTNQRYSRFEDQQLTPRTPHSRAGRAEEAFTAAELEQVHFDDDDDYNSIIQQQNAPLLASSASDSFPPPRQVGYRSRGDDYEERMAAAAAASKRKLMDKIMARLPLAVYSSVAAVLLVLVVVSLREPEVLKQYVGVPVANGTASAAVASASVGVAVDLESVSASAPAPSATVASAPSHVHGGSVPNGITRISYENHTTFPLDPIEYRAQCIAVTPPVMIMHPYWLPHELMDTVHIDEQPGYTLKDGEAPICNRTITYQLDGWAGLLVDLGLIAQFAALAKEASYARSATFFVDDRYWNRGKWTDHFENIAVGPEPGCRPPPPEEYVACPRSARHWIVNSRTARYHLGHMFAETYEDPYGHNLNRAKPIYDRAAQALETLIIPNNKSVELIGWAREEMQGVIEKHYQHGEDRRRSFKDMPQDSEYEFRTQGYIGTHIRRGDQLRSWHGATDDYVPIQDYVDGVVSAWTRLDLELSKNDTMVTPVVYVASDSPAAMQEFSASFDLEQVFSLTASKRAELRELASPRDYDQNEFMTLPEDVRVKATRGMVVDFALLSGAWAKPGELIPDATVCGLRHVKSFLLNHD
ncbi:hypothetical protein HMN09_00904300 [Mycena chlorophos]|uniref:Uncharacterized protein n=1 Tax=Mycena chlorophos TaxID=658473 RepID=A0A8H6SRM5_MYCCL|nr:hypothetical protein HMN09_00904300 [Mycena chlorophos]